MSDIRVYLALLAQTETLSSDGAGLVMVLGRLLTMIEADGRRATSGAYAEAGLALLRDRDFGSGSPDEIAVDAALVEMVEDSRSASPEDRIRLRKAIIDRYESAVAELETLRIASAASDKRGVAGAYADMRDRFRDYLSRKAGRPIGPLKRFGRITGGYSKTSIAAELDAEDDFGWGTKFLVRLDTKDGPTSFTVADEFPLLSRLLGSAVPVAQAFACETDPSVLGQPFLVSALLPGVSARSGDPTVAAWGDDPVTRRELGVQIAQALGALHSVPLMEKPTRSSQDQVRTYLNEWRDRWQGLDAPPDPGLTLAFDWLDENIPSQIERLAYVHGDFAPYNALQDEGRLTAIIDWEFLHIGDPAEDVGYCRNYLESLLPWDEFLANYYESGGPQYHSDSAIFYEVWCNVRNTVVLLQGRQAYAQGRNRDPKILYASVEFYHYFLSNALKSIRQTL